MLWRVVLLFFSYRTATSEESYSALYLPQFFFQKSLIPCCFRLLLRIPGRTESWSAAASLCIWVCRHSTTFINNILELEEREQSDPLFVSGNCIIEGEAKIRRDTGRVVCFVFFFKLSNSSNG